LRNRGELLAETGQLDDAESALRTVIDLLMTRADGNEADGLAHRATMADARDILGRVLIDRGRYEEAVSEINRAVQVTSALVNLEPDNPQYLESRAAANVYLGSVLRILGRYKEEAAAYQQAIADYEDLTEALPGVAVFEESLALTRSDLGNLLYKLGNSADAEKELNQAQLVYRQLVTEYPEAGRYDGLAYCQDVKGEVLRDRGDLAEAKTLFEECIRIYEQLIQALGDRAIPKYTESLALCHSHLAQTHFLLEEQEEASREFTAAIDLLAGLEQPTPGNLDKLAFIHCRQALLLIRVGKRDEALQGLREARELWTELASADEAAAEHRHNLALFLINCPEVEFRDAEKSLSLAKQLTAEIPNNADYWSTLGAACYRNGMWEEASEALQKAIDVRQSEHGRDWFLLAMTRCQMNEMDKARKDYRRGQEWFEANLPYNLDLRALQQEAAETLGLEKQDD
jgi:tetratricopeptide (TPR) repeat protein